MKRLPIRWTWLVVVPLLALLGWRIVRLATGPSPTVPRAEDLKAATREVKPAGGADQREALGPAGSIGGNGVVEPRERETRVGAVAAGRIAVIRMNEGQWVEPGDVLVVLDGALESAAVELGEAQLRAAQASLRQALRGSRPEEIRAALAEAEQAGARAVLAETEAKRSERLAQSGAIAGDELARSVAQAKVESAAAEAASAKRDAVVAGTRPEQRELAQADLAAARARLDQAKVALDRLTIRSPVRGEVLQIKARIGEYVQPGAEPLVVIGDTSHLRARVDVDERDVGGLRRGAKARIRAAAWPDRELVGEVVDVGRRMGRKNVRSDDSVERNDTKILEVVVALPESSGLIVGQRVTAYLERSASGADAGQAVALAAGRPTACDRPVPALLGNAD
jgi:HlyD family secretion protein